VVLVVRKCAQSMQTVKSVAAMVHVTKKMAPAPARLASSALHALPSALASLHVKATASANSILTPKKLSARVRLVSLVPLAPLHAPVEVPISRSVLTRVPVVWFEVAQGASVSLDLKAMLAIFSARERQRRVSVMDMVPVCLTAKLRHAVVRRVSSEPAAKKNALGFSPMALPAVAVVSVLRPRLERNALAGQDSSARDAMSCAHRTSLVMYVLVQENVSSRRTPMVFRALNVPVHLAVSTIIATPLAQVTLQMGLFAVVTVLAISSKRLTTTAMFN